MLIGTGSGGNSYSVPIQTLLFFTALSFAPGTSVDDGFYLYRDCLVIVEAGYRYPVSSTKSGDYWSIAFLDDVCDGANARSCLSEAYLPYTNNTLTFEQALQKSRSCHA